MQRNHVKSYKLRLLAFYADIMYYEHKVLYILKNQHQQFYYSWKKGQN